MWVALTNRVARVTRATPEERAWLRGYLSFPDPRAHFQGREGDDAYEKLFNEADESFPAGFTSPVVAAARDADVKVELIDNRVVPAPRDADADLAWLRPYQLVAVDRCDKRVRGILHHATGAGKSEVAVALTRALPAPWLFLAPNLTLVNNTADRFLKRNREHGVDLGEPGRIGEGDWTEGDRLTCATYQSIYQAIGTEKWRRLMARVKGLICDESHSVPAVTFRRATELCDAYWRIGLSATPLARGDMKSAWAVAMLGPVIHRVTAAELVASGDISDARVRMVTVQHPMPDGFRYDEVYQELIVDSAVRNAVIVQLAQKAEKPAFLFVRKIEHGRVLMGQLTRAGVRAEFVWGARSTRQIDAYVSALKRGAIDVIVTSAVLKQGVDVPSLRTVINAAGGKSIIDALQKLGRGSRLEKDADGQVVKDTFDLIDVMDVGNEWIEKHAKDRRRAYMAEGYRVTVEGQTARAKRQAARGKEQSEFDWKPEP